MAKASQALRRQAARLSLTTLSMSAIARQLNVSHVAIQNWRKSIWWQELVDEVAKEEEEDSKIRLRKVIEQADLAVSERLTKGDERMARDGSVHHVAISGRDAMLISSLARDKLRIAENKPTRITASVDALLKLRDQLVLRESSTLEGELCPQPASLPSQPGKATAE